MKENITQEEKMLAINEELKMVTAKLSDCKKEQPLTSAQKLKWRNRLQRLKSWRAKLLFQLNELNIL